MGNILHKISDVARAACGKRDRTEPTCAIIVASGSSTRMGDALGGATSKQFIMLDGIPVVARTIMAFDACECISEIIVVAREEDFCLYQELQRLYHFNKLVRLVSGGKTRQESVRNGFSAVSNNMKYVAIHDGARCLITPQSIEQVCTSAYKHGAASAATRAIDSVKLTDGKSKVISSSVERGRVWLAQTPQVFKREIYELALTKAEDDGTLAIATDDNSLVEAIGISIMLVECGRTNIKLTEPEDVPMALAILKAREGEK